MPRAPLPSETDPDALSIPQLFNQLVVDGELLVRGEMRLAQAQLAHRFRAAVPAILALMLGSLFLLASLFMLLLAVIGWLAPTLGDGNAALVVMLATAAIGLTSIYAGYKRLDMQAKIDIPPSQEPQA